MSRDRVSSSRVPEQFRLFEQPTLSAGVETAYTDIVLPASPSTREDLVDFYVPISEYYTDLSETLLYLNAQISLPSDQTEAAPCNNFFYLLFDRIDVELNGVPLTTSYNDCGYKAFFHILLNYPDCVKNTFLQSIMWFPDDPDGIKLRNLPPEENKTDRTLPPSKNEGLRKRHILSALGKEFPMAGKIMHELFMVKQLLPPGLSIKVRLYRKDAKFCLMSPSDTTNFKIKLTDLRLHVRHVKPNAKLTEAMEKKLRSSAALYCVNRGSNVKTKGLPKDVKSISIDNIFNSEALPDRIIFALVPHNQYLGSLASSPYNFEPHGLEEISLTIDNTTITYKMDFFADQYMELYLAIATQLGNKDLHCSPNIEYSDVGKSMAIYPFDLTPMRDSTDCLHQLKAKNARLDLKFRETLKEPLQLICYMESPFLFSINEKREVNTSINYCE